MAETKKVLIAEPNLRLANRLAEELGALGFEVEQVRDGLATLQSAGRARFDLLVLNLILPKVSGAEVARKLRKSAGGGALKIVVMSPQLRDPATADKLCEELALGPYFQMPFNFAYFRQQTVKYLAGGDRGISAAEQQRLAAQRTQATAPAAAPKPAPVPSAPAAPAALKPAVPASAASPSPTLPPSVPKAQMTPPPPRPALSPAPAPPPAPAARGALSWGVGKPCADLAAVLRKLWDEKFTGRARLQGEGALKMITFERGLPVDAAALHPARPFGEHLAAAIALAPAERAALSSAGSADGGAALRALQMGALEWPKLFEERRAFAADELAQCLAWNVGEAHLDPAPAAPGGLGALLGLPILVAAFAKRAQALKSDAPRLTRLEAELQLAHLARTSRFYELVRFFPADETASKVLTAVSGTKPFLQIMQGTADKHGAVALAWALLALGMVEKSPSARDDAPAPFPFRPLEQPKPAPAPPPPAVKPAAPKPIAQPAATAPTQKPKPLGEVEIIDLGADLEEDLGDVLASAEAKAEQAPPPGGANEIEAALLAELERVKSADYYKIFDTRSNRFKFGEVKQKYFELQRKFSPDKFIMSPAEIMSKCEEYLETISKAFETLSDVKKKMAYDDQLSQKKMLDEDRKAGGGLQASISFESGKALIKEGDVLGAEREIRKAMQLAPGKVEHEVYLARALYVNPKTRGDMGAQVRVRQMLDRALVKSPKLADAYGFRASIFLDQGKLDLAEADLVKALKFDPQLLHAKQEMRRLDQLRQKR